jgi:hypothetical protein
MKKHFAFLFIVLIFALVLCGAPSAATINFNNSTGIQNATNTTNDRDTLNLSAGTYNEYDIIVDNNLTIEGPTISGSNPFTAVIDAQQLETVFNIPTGVTVTPQYLLIQNWNAQIDTTNPNGGGNTLTLTLTSALSEAKYIISSYASSITDLLRNPVTAKISHFREEISPNITTTDPANCATIPTNKAITITFDQPIKVWNKNIQLKTSNGTDIPITQSISGNTLIITPTNPLATNTQYILIIYKAAVTDLAGNPNTSKSINFTT